MLLPVLFIVLIIGLNIWRGHASLPTAVLYTIIVICLVVWPFRRRRR
jgi:hypothetical protein